MQVNVELASTLQARDYKDPPIVLRCALNQEAQTESHASMNELLRHSTQPKEDKEPHV